MTTDEFLTHPTRHSADQPDGEQMLLDSVYKLTRAARRSTRPGVAAAAIRIERRLKFDVKIRRQAIERRPRKNVVVRVIRVES